MTRILRITAALLLPAGLTAQEEMKPDVVLEGHEADVYDLAFSPDATKLVTASFDQTIRIWSLPDGKALGTLKGHEGKVLSIEFSPDGGSVLSGSEDKTVKLWDIPGGGVQTLAEQSGNVEALELAGGAKWLFTAAADGHVRMWDRAGENERLRLGGEAGVLRRLAVSPDVRRVASGGEGGTVWMWDISSITAPAPAVSAEPGKAVELVAAGATWRYFKGKSAPAKEWNDRDFDASEWAEGPSGFGYSSNVDELATVKTKLDDMRGGGYLSLYARHPFELDDPGRVEKLSLRVLIDDGFVAYLNGEEVGRSNIEGSPPDYKKTAGSAGEPASIDVDLTPHRGKLKKGRNVLSIQGHNGNPSSSDFVMTPVLSGVFKPVEKKPEEPPKPETTVVKLEAGGPILALAWSPSGELLAAGGKGKQAFVWKKDGSVLEELAQGGRVGGLAFIDDNRLAAAGEGGAVKVWNVAEGKVERQLEGHEGEILALAIRGDRKRLLTGGSDRSVRLWDAESFQEILKIDAHEGAVHAVAFGVDAGTVASGGADGRLRVWKVEDGSRVREFRQAAEVLDVAEVEKDQYYSSGGTKSVARWREASSEPLRTFSGHGGAVHTATFSPDRSLVASASSDKTVRLWNPADGKQLRSIDAHGSSVYTLAFSRDGKVLASGGFDRVIKLWNPEDGKELGKLEGHAEGVFCLRFSRDGKFLYSGSSDRTIRKWSVGEHQQVALFEGHPGWVCGLDILPGETSIVSVDYGGNLIRWSDADASRQGHRKLLTVVYDLALSADGKWIGTANLSSTAFLVSAPRLMAE